MTLAWVMAAVLSHSERDGLHLSDSLNRNFFNSVDLYEPEPHFISHWCVRGSCCSNGFIKGRPERGLMSDQCTRVLMLCKENITLNLVLTLCMFCVVVNYCLAYSHRYYTSLF